MPTIPIENRVGLLDYARVLGHYSRGRIIIDAHLPADQRERVIRHELTHARQHAESGLSWEAWLAEYRRIKADVGYLNHPWEIEARKAERIAA